jgi:hypothetical protein
VKCALLNDELPGFLKTGDMAFTFMPAGAPKPKSALKPGRPKGKIANMKRACWKSAIFVPETSSLSNKAVRLRRNVIAG